MFGQNVARRLGHLGLMASILLILPNLACATTYNVLHVFKAKGMAVFLRER